MLLRRPKLRQNRRRNLARKIIVRIEDRAKEFFVDQSAAKDFSGCELGSSVELGSI